MQHRSIFLPHKTLQTLINRGFQGDVGCKFLRHLTIHSYCVILLRKLIYLCSVQRLCKGIQGYFEMKGMHISMPFSVQQYSNLFHSETWITAHGCSLLYKIFCKKNYCTRCLKPCKQWVSGNAWDLKTVLWHKNPGHLHCILCKHFCLYNSNNNVL